jgi:glycosyltransferase involved in cell wall biosynthesis
MKILLVSALAPDMKCGIGDYTGHLAKALSARRCEVAMASSTANHAGGFGLRNGIRWVPVRKWSVRSLIETARTLKAAPPDVVHLQYPGKVFRRSIGVVCAPLIFRHVLNRPFVTTLHVFRAMPAYKKPPFVAVGAASNHIVVTAEREKDALAILGLAGRTTYIPIGPNLDWGDGPLQDERERQRIRAEWGIGPQEFAVCCYGFIERNKRLESVIEAVARLDERTPARLLVIGPFEPASNRYHLELASLTERFNIKHRVHWAGYRSSRDVIGLLSASDAAVLLYPDGLSWQRTALLTALSCGLPVIGNIGPGIPADIEHGRNVLFIRDSTPQSVHGALQTLLTDPGMRHELGSTGRQTALRRPNWDQVAQWHLDMYPRVVCAYAARRGLDANEWGFVER